MTKIEQLEKQLDAVMESLGYERRDKKGVFFYWRGEREYEIGVYVGFESVFAVRSNKTAPCRDYWIKRFDGEYMQIIYPEGHGFGTEYESSTPVEETVKAIEEWVRAFEQRLPVYPAENGDLVL